MNGDDGDIYEFMLYSNLHNYAWLSWSLYFNFIAHKISSLHNATEK